MTTTPSPIDAWHGHAGRTWVELQSVLDRMFQPLLADGGWKQGDIQPLDATCVLPESELASYFSRLGPVGVALQQADASIHDRVIAALRPAFDPYVHGDKVRFNAACWIIRALAT